tara:strand:+ start:933 stop:1487 length:555 start_codon:yes stop_codon:yes gene_type:complete
LETIQDFLADVQHKLKVPKSNVNTFGKYKYRNCEDILENVKPLLNGKATLTLSDDVVNVGAHNYIKATASLFYKGDAIAVSALAREAVTKKGMDDSQITGTSSSYARKYALNGLFCIDDTKDADATNHHQTATIADCKLWIDEAVTVENLRGDIWQDIVAAGHSENASVISHAKTKTKQLNESN